MAEAPNQPDSANEEQFLSTLLAETPELWSVVDMFVRTLPDQVSAMRDALRTQAFDRLQAIARQVQKAGLANGFRSVADRAAGIEQAAHDQVIDGLNERIAEMTDLIAKIQAGLQRTNE
jgi:hypothetical protein